MTLSHYTLSLIHPNNKIHLMTNKRHSIITKILYIRTVSDKRNTEAIELIRDPGEVSHNDQVLCNAPCLTKGLREPIELIGREVLGHSPSKVLCNVPYT